MRFGKRKGYQTFSDGDGREHYVHIRVMEKKLGGSIPEGQVVHHINGNKSDNRPANLTAVSPGVHGRLHGNFPRACFICGHMGHWAEDCYARRDYAGRLL
ncbi:MAG TPA: HNH endonuclease signature motif containing protein [Myxococcaceae bacterium]